jgi:hypothetical protein
MRAARPHRSRRVVALAAVAGACLVLAAALLLVGRPRPPVPLPEPVPARQTDPFTTAGQSTFWAGVNYPWKTGQDTTLAATGG